MNGCTANIQAVAGRRRWCCSGRASLRRRRRSRPSRRRRARSAIAGRPQQAIAEASQGAPYPTFAQIPPLPTDVRSIAAWKASVVAHPVRRRRAWPSWRPPSPGRWATPRAGRAASAPRPPPPPPITAAVVASRHRGLRRGHAGPSYAASAEALGRGGCQKLAPTRLALHAGAVYPCPRNDRRAISGQAPMTPDFPRIRRLPPYVFEEVNRLKARLRGRGRRHHRLRHGQSRHADAQAHRRQADRDRPRSQEPAAIRPPRASPACGAPWPATTTAASA